MTLFWILTGVMALGVAIPLTLSVLRGRRDTGPAEAFDLKVYRDQLSEVDRDLARGTIHPEEAERLRTEVSRRLLAADAQARAVGDDGTQPWAATQVVAVLLGLAVAGGGFALYTQIGAPGYPDLPLAARIAQAEIASSERPAQAEAEASVPGTDTSDAEPEYLELVQRLRGAVAERPDDLQGFTLLARSEAALGNFKAAYEAQERIIALRGDAATAKDHADLADMMILAAGGYVSPQAEAALDEALARNPTNGVARYYKGLAQAQIGRPDRAFEIWDALLRESDADAPWVGPIRGQIEEIAFRAGVSDYALPERGTRGPSAQDIENAAELSPEARDDMVRGMVAGLSDRLATEGGPPEDWARLITALGVLGDESQARAIWAEAQAVFADAPDALARVRAAAREAGFVE